MANGCAQIVNCASGYLDFHFHFLLPFIFLLKNICTGKMSPKKTGNYDPDFLKEKFSHFFKFSLHERNWDRKKVEPFCKTEVIVKKPFETWQFGKIGVLVTFLSQFLSCEENLRGMREFLFQNIRAYKSWMEFAWIE